LACCFRKVRDFTEELDDQFQVVFTAYLLESAGEKGGRWDERRWGYSKLMISSPSPYPPEPEFVNVESVKESIPKNRFRQPI
jgi:hypothetical protein